MNLSLSSFPGRCVLVAAAIATPSLAQTLIPFTNGTVANANDVNANFNRLKDSVTAAQAEATAAATAAADVGTSVGNLTSAIVVTAPKVQLDRRLQFPSSIASRKVVLFEGSDNDHQFLGFGINSNTLRYQLNNANDNHVFFAAASATSSTELMRIQGNGNVGIGVSAPSDRLEVAGNLRLRSADRLRFGAPAENTDPMFIRRVTFIGANSNQSGLDFVFGDDPAGDPTVVDFIRFATENADGSGFQDRFVFRSDGFCSKPGGGTWASFSDSRLKDDIQPLQGTLDRLLQLRGTTFTYKDPNHGATPGTQIGFVAQEVEQVFPQWVRQHESGMKMVAISGFEALTVESLRELDAQNKALAAENEALKSRVAGLEAMAAEVAALKAALQPLLAK